MELKQEPTVLPYNEIKEGLVQLLFENNSRRYTSPRLWRIWMAPHEHVRFKTFKDMICFHHVWNRHYILGWLNKSHLSDGIQQNRVCAYTFLDWSKGYIVLEKELGVSRVGKGHELKAKVLRCWLSNPGISGLLNELGVRNRKGEWTWNSSLDRWYYDITQVSSMESRISRVKKKKIYNLRYF